MGSVFTVQPGEKILIPLHNHQNSCIGVAEQVVAGAIQVIKAEQMYVDVG